MKKRVTVRMRTYDLLRRAVEEGCAYASNRFSKHLDGDMTIDDLDRDALAVCFEEAVMNELSETVDFETEVE